MAASDAFLSALLGGVTGGVSKTLTDDPALDAFSRTAASNSIYNQIANPILNTRFNTSTWSPTESAAVSLGQSFLGGLLGNLGRQDVAKQYETAASILPDLYRNPSAVSLPEGVDAEAFGALKLAALRDNAKRERQLQDSVIANVMTRDPRYAALAPETAAKVGLSEIGRALSSQSQQDTPPSQLGEFDRLKMEYGGDETLARQAIKDRLELATKEKQQAANMDQTLNFIDNKFNRAKEITGIGAALPLTPKNQELAGLGDSVILQIDKLLGREMNSDVRQRVLNMAPKWYDDPDTIETKRGNLKEFIGSLTNAPIGDKAKAIAGASPTLENPKEASGGEGLPVVGGTFNGKKVLSVRKIK